MVVQGVLQLGSLDLSQVLITEYGKASIYSSVWLDKGPYIYPLLGLSL